MKVHQFDSSAVGSEASSSDDRTSVEDDVALDFDDICPQTDCSMDSSSDSHGDMTPSLSIDSIVGYMFNMDDDYDFDFLMEAVDDIHHSTLL
jgi:hypothetical protein